MTFHERTGLLVVLSNNNRTARRTQSSQEFNNGIVFSKNPLPNDEIFEVCIDKKMNSWSGSIEVGVCSLDPNTVEFPSSASGLRDSAWIMSGNSVSFDGETKIDDYGLDLDQLGQGDRVGVQKTASGELHIWLNGVDQGVAASDLPEKVYAVIDMYGKCSQVSVVEAFNNAPKEETELLPNSIRRVPSSNEILVFHERCGTLVKLSNNNRTAERRRPLDEFNNGVVMTNRPIKDNEVFEIKIERIVDKWSGSIEMGITTYNPANFDFPATMTNLRSGTIMMSGCGILTNGKGTRREYGDFNLDLLREGDFIGLVREDSGDLHYYINGMDQGVAATHTPQTVFGVVDLYGMTVKATITSRTVITPTCSQLDSPMDSIRRGAPAVDDGGSRAQSEKLLFHARCGAHVVVTNSGRTCLRPNALEDFNNGVVLTSRPLKDLEMCEVRIDKMVEKWAGSIEIGVTRHSPRELDFPSTMTNIRSGTWVMTGNGVMYNGTTIIDNYGQNLDRLKAGDRVGVMRKENGDLHFYVNGIDQGVAAHNVPKKLFGVIDLYGQAIQTTIVDPEDEGSLPALESGALSSLETHCVSNVAVTNGSGNGSADESANLLRFHSLHGTNAVILNDGLTASRPNARGEFNDAIVMSNRPLQVGELFEILIEMMVDRWSGSIEAGVTAIQPEDLDFPNTMTDISYNTWMLSGSAVMKDGNTIRNGYRCDLDSLGVNSRIGMMRCHDATLHYYVNGEDMGVACTDLPTEVYAVIDLYGQCAQVSILNPGMGNENSALGMPSSRSMATAGGPALQLALATPSVPSMAHHFHSHFGKNINTFFGHCTATRLRGFDSGVVFGSRPLQPGETFEVKVDRVSRRWSGSLHIGLTTYVPHEAMGLGHLPPVATDMRSKSVTWLMVGSEIWRNGHVVKQNYGPSLERLEVGSRVGVKKCTDGTMHIVINGEDRGIGVSNLPKTVYAILDLYGKVETVSITSSALEPPENVRPPSISSSDSDGDSCNGGDNHSEEDREVDQRSRPWDLMTPPLNFSFHENHGRNVELCSENRVARRTASYNQGITVCSQPLPKMHLFQVRIESLDPQWTSSLQIGVVTIPPPPDKLSLPTSASAIKKSSWVVHGDSVFHNSVKIKANYGPNLESLQIGHKVGVLLDLDLCLHLYVNGLDQGIAAWDISQPCYAMVDLYGQCNKVCIIRDDSLLAMVAMNAEDREKADIEDGLKESVCRTPPAADLSITKHCEYQGLCLRFKSTLGLPESYFDPDPKFNICYCETCHKIRGDEPYYKRGEPPSDYALPFGWARLALRASPRAEPLRVFKEWHVAFYGTGAGAVRRILDTGALTTQEPSSLGRGGIKVKEKESLTNGSGSHQQQIVLSPTIRYTGSQHFAHKHKFKDPKTRKWHSARIAFQVCVRPNSYQVGPQTIGANEQIDPKFSNNEIEWTTKEKGAVVLYGLLIKIEPYHT